MVFHVRDAFPEFWRITNASPRRLFRSVRGVIHCFTAGVRELQGSLERGLHIALNGIMTFTKDEAQLDAARQGTHEPPHVLLKPTAHFLRPLPMRGKRNEPANLAPHRRVPRKSPRRILEDLEHATTTNALNSVWDLAHDRLTEASSRARNTQH